MKADKEFYTTSIKVDAIDLRILDLLQSDAKLTNKEIAYHLDMTTTPVYERIKRMEKTGVIKKYVALLNHEAIGKELMAICMVQLNKHSKELLLNFEKEVLKIKDVMECFHLAGHYDYLIKVMISDMRAYQDFIVNKLAALENVGNVQSAFVMKELKNDTAIYLVHTE